MSPSPHMLELLHQIQINGFEISITETLPDLGKITVQRIGEEEITDFDFSTNTQDQVAHDLALRV